MQSVPVVAALSLSLGLTIAAHPPAHSQQPAATHGTFYAPDKIKWKDGPPSLPAGAKFVILEGDPSAKGQYFAMRLAMPDGYIIPPHWHPGVERVTVISGTFEVGMGKTVDTDAMNPNPAGSYLVLQPKMPHFARASGPTVVQLTSIGPWGIHYVDPKDDPRKQTK
jgi:quercetin dioxygenase-like cupin family protein